MSYEFNEQKHVHLLDGKPLYGITSVLSVIAKPALIQWSANQACEYLKEKWGKDGLSEEQLFEAIEEARTAHLRKKESAGKWGTETHERIEMIVKDAIKNYNGIVQLKESDEPSVQNFLDWAKDKRFIESEKNLWSEKHWIGGIVDLVFEHRGKTYIGDIKTSSGIYPEAFLQCAGYEVMLEEMGMNIAGYEIINLRKDGKMQTARSYGTERNKQAFLAALNLYKTLEELKKENGNSQNYNNK